SLYAAMLGIMIIGSLLLAKARLRHHLAEAQTEYEQLFRYTLENIALAAVSVDRTGTVTFCNDYFLELTGWGHDDVVGSNWLERFTPAEQRDSARELLKLMQTPDTFPSTWETEVQSRDKSRHLMFWTNNLSFNANGDVIGVTSIGEDITDARKTEEELRKLSGAVEQSPSIVLITNRDGMIEYVNPKFTEITGYASAEVIGSSPSFLKSGDTSPNEYRKLWEIISAGKEWRGEFHNRKKNGELYWESAAISAIRNQDGEITNYLAVKEDITERKRLEREVEERNRELAKTQTLAVMGRMASMIAHDLRNPLSSVKMSMQILGKQADQQQDKKALELRQIALEQIRYMEEILSDMLTYSRPDALKTEWLSIDKLLDMATGLAQKRIAEYGVKVTTHYQPGLPTFPGDANKLRQVFSNLIVNAAQATEGMDDQAPLMSIETMLQLGTSGTSIQVKISDNGAGFDPEEQDKLFEPFFTTRAKGTGLGLAIVKRIIDQHHGTVELRSRGSRGTNAMVTLPTRTDADTEKTVGGIQ
ncbi:MAG: PAS domain S-box protein, partial [Gammaproteobacteria bacterium]|nr:PAS domain S-box protein [Gammaproteobacteria bacterium]